MKPLIRIAMFWIAMIACASAYVTTTTGPDGLIGLTMIGGVQWRDKMGVPYRNQRVAWLQINNADLTKDDVEEVAALQGLKELTLGFGPEGVILKHTDLSAIKSLKELEHLALCIENPAGVRLDFVRHFLKLNSLVLEQCGDGTLKGLAPLKLENDLAEIIGRLPQLTALDIRRCELNDEVVARLVQSGQLTNLSISTLSIGITDHSMRYISQNQHLKALHLDSSNFTDGIGDRLTTFRNLTELSLRSSQLTPNILNSISQLSKLKRLSITLPQASTTDFALLRSMTNLESLRIDGCVISEPSVLALKGHPNLNVLLLPGNDASLAARDTIMSLPRIEYAQLGSWKFDRPDKSKLIHP